MSKLKNILLALLFIAIGASILRLPLLTVGYLKNYISNRYLTYSLFVPLHAINMFFLLSLAKIMTKKIDKTTMSKIYIKRGKDQRKLFLLGLLIASVSSFIVALIYYILYNPIYELKVVNPLLIIIVIIVSFIATFFQAGTEEIWIRSYSLKHMGDVIGPKRAVFLTAIIFSLLHFMNPHYQIVSIFSCLLSGIMMGWAVIATGSIWMALGLHAGWNFTSKLLFHGTVFSVTNIEGQKLTIFNTAEGSYVGVTVTAVTLLFVIYITKKMKGKYF